MEANDFSDKSAFPWELGVFDAHCHPTDTMSSVGDISSMKTISLTIMATRGEDQELVAQVASTYRSRDVTDLSDQTIPRVIPCFGWHPWFSHQILDDTKGSGTALGKAAHYKSVLIPSIEDDTFLQTLPEPRSLSTLISETRDRLQRYPNGLVGEIGLDRSFRIPNALFSHEVGNGDGSLIPGLKEGRTLSPYRVQLSHQKAVLKAQLQLAGSLHRAASVHSVQTHGAVLEILQELWSGYEKKPLSNRQKKRRGSVPEAHEQSGDEYCEGAKEPIPQSLPFPPRICLHSYSGPLQALRQFLHPSVPADIYFSFSNVINFSNDSPTKVMEVIEALPEDRILVESDFHCAGQRMDDLMQDVVQKICAIRNWSLEYGTRKLGDNWRRFALGKLNAEALAAIETSIQIA